MVASARRVQLHVATVTSADGIRFVAAEPTAERLARQLARYVRVNAPHALASEDAQSVERALAAGRDADAVERYFATVGRRWDQEFLFRTSVEVELATSGAETGAAARAGLQLA